jgi:hypothetical protein
VDPATKLLKVVLDQGALEPSRSASCDAAGWLSSGFLITVSLQYWDTFSTIFPGERPSIDCAFPLTRPLGQDLPQETLTAQPHERVLDGSSARLSRDRPCVSFRCRPTTRRSDQPWKIGTLYVLAVYSRRRLLGAISVVVGWSKTLSVRSFTHFSPMLTPSQFAMCQLTISGLAPLPSWT